MPHHELRPTLLLPEEYVADATRLIRAAKHRVYFMCLIVTDELKTGDFIKALQEAAARGVEVHVAADVFTYGDLAGSFFPTFYRSKRNRESNRMATALAAAGVNFTWLGKTYWFPFRGRTHSKFCVVDDVVFSFGGVNLYDKGVENVDYMLRVDDPMLAHGLADLFRRFRRSKLEKKDGKSFGIKFGKSRVLIDGGRVGDSIIYDRACKWAAEAESILLVSQYCPTGRLGRLIKKVPHQLYFNPPSNASGLNRWVIRSGMWVSGIRTLYTRRRYLHAKCMIFTLPNGNKVAITGSHNFSWGGVRLGTREIALQTRDPRVIAQLEEFFTEHVR